jgi:hypothetical protein
MPNKQETLNLMQYLMGMENYRKMIDSAGGEDKVWRWIQDQPGGAEEFCKKLIEQAQKTISKTESRSRSSSGALEGVGEMIGGLIGGILIIGGIALAGYLLYKFGGSIIAFFVWVFKRFFG